MMNGVSARGTGRTQVLPKIGNLFFVVMMSLFCIHSRKYFYRISSINDHYFQEHEWTHV